MIADSVDDDEDDDEDNDKDDDDDVDEDDAKEDDGDDGDDDDGDGDNNDEDNCMGPFFACAAARSASSASVRAPGGSAPISWCQVAPGVVFSGATSGEGSSRNRGWNRRMKAPVR